MAGELQLAARCEDANARGMLWIGGRKDERRLREVQFARNLLHGCGVESDRIGKYASGLPSKATVVKTSTFTNPYERA